MLLKADFHMHSCLSPCGDLSMSPSAIVEILAQKGIQIAALTDHNTALNCPAFAALCKQRGIAPLFGLEVQTMEEIHVVCLFSSIDTALLFNKELSALIPHIPNNPEKMGDQIVVDEEENIIDEVDYYLIMSAEIGIDDLARRVHELEGLVIPAHVDRAAFSLTSQLGFIPDGEWDALEVVRLPQADSPNPALNEAALSYPLITSSDAHYVEHVGRRAFMLDIGDRPLYNEDKTVNIETIRLALQESLIHS